MGEPEFVEVDGHRIACHRQGEGEPVLLVHGITTYSFIWRRMMPGLTSNYDVIAVDMLGCGDSDKPTGVDYSITAQADIMFKLMDGLGVDDFHLVTHDIGGGVGQIMAVSEPERVKDLVLINSVAYDFWPVQPIITMRIPIIRQMAMATLEFGLFRLLVKHGMYHKERVTDELMDLFWRPMKTQDGRRGFLHLAKCIDNSLLTGIADDLRKLQVPVMIIRGDADPYLDAEISEKLHEEIPGSRLERIETGGHFIQEDEPGQLVKLIDDFISGRADG